MNVITDPAPPVPIQVDITETSPDKKLRLSPSWKHWFLQIREKINSINQNLFDLSNVVGTGLATKNPDGTWTTTSVVDVGSGGTGINSVDSGNFLRGTGGAASLEERTPSQVLSDIEACPAITVTHTSATGGTATALPSQPVGYAEVIIDGQIRRIPYYD